MASAAVVYNPTKLTRDQLHAVIEPARLAAGWDETRWYETQADSPGTRQALAAVAEGCGLVLAVGGDGTVRAVAEGLEGSGVPMAVIPRGTGNLLAKNLALPIGDLAHTVRIAFQGPNREIDLGVLECRRPDGSEERHAFVVIAGMGLDAQIMATTDEGLKKRFGMLAYVKAGALVLLQGRRMLLQFRIDGGPPRQTKVHTVLVGNVGMIGANVKLMPDAQPDDGLLDVVAARPSGPFGWQRVAWRVLVDNAFLRHFKPKAWRDRDDNARELTYRQCREISLVLREPEEVQLDGDYLGEIRSVRVTVEPNGLVVKMPLDWAPPVAIGTRPSA